MKSIPFLLFALLLTGCTTTSLGPVNTQAVRQIHLSDQRPESEKENFRASIVSPAILLGDDNFDISPMLYIKDAVAKNKPSSVSTVSVVIDHFRVADFFPQRLTQGREAAITGALAASGLPGIYGDTPIPEQDAIICTMTGTINGRSFQSTARVPYQLALVGLSVRKDKSWVYATKKSIDNCVVSAIAQTLRKH